jgi:hypothetical protein
MDGFGCARSDGAEITCQNCRMDRTNGRRRRAGRTANGRDRKGESARLNNICHYDILRVRRPIIMDSVEHPAL